jgi:hypothetical protein
MRLKSPFVSIENVLLPLKMNSIIEELFQLLFYLKERFENVNKQH